jgi:hypothetical protein
MAAEMDIGTSALAALARTTYQTDLAGRKSCWVKNETAKALGQEIIWRAAHRSLAVAALDPATLQISTSSLRLDGKASGQRLTEINLCETRPIFFSGGRDVQPEAAKPRAVRAPHEGNATLLAETEQGGDATSYVRVPSNLSKY